MSEEFVTLSIIKWLEINNWKIVSFDFPQSGTGKSLKPKDSDSEKNKGNIIPDIVAFRGGVVIFFENKDRFYFDDFKKINTLRITDIYQDSINKMLNGYDVSLIYYGIGVPNKNSIKLKSEKNKEMVDFIILVDDEKKVIDFYNLHNIKFN